MVVATASGGSAPADSLLAVVAAPGGPVVITDITQFNYGVGNNLTVTLIVDMRDSGELLGSTTVDMGWDPSLMTFQSYATASLPQAPFLARARSR